MYFKNVFLYNLSINLKMKFCNDFDKDKHIRPVDIGSGYFYLSFDFNAATLWQINVKDKVVNCIMEFPPMLGLKQQCDEIKRILDEKNIKVFLTGDSKYEWGNVQKKLSTRILLPSKVAKFNLDYGVSFYLVNSILKNWNVSIDEKCTSLINDCANAIYNNHSANNYYYLDTMCYVFHNVLYEYEKIPLKMYI